jgi:alpha-galactosidase
MGWNSWNKYDCNITDADVRTNADMIVNLGLNSLGYQYVNVDDCWLTNERDSNNHVIVDSV